MPIKELNSFLSTPTRRTVFLYYVFSNISPSDMVSETKIPFSTVDRITQLLKAHNILLEGPGKDMREKRYTVNFNSWLRGNLKMMGLDFIDDSQIRQIREILGDKKFFTLSFLFINPNFIIEFFKDPLEIGDDIPFLTLMEMNHFEERVAQIPSFILVYLKFSPVFKKLIEDIDRKLLDGNVRVINRLWDKITVYQIQ
ncbi:MAG: hypothetical protein QXY45_03665 [Candidatus Aenigmatarchaeota archaeon]